LKTGGPARVPWVRISPPPFLLRKNQSGGAADR